MISYRVILFALGFFVKTSVEVTNGHKVNSDKTYMVYLLEAPAGNKFIYADWLCGGVIIHPLYVLTAASCLADVEYAYVVSGYRRYVNAKHLHTDKCISNMKKRIIAHCEMKPYLYIFDHKSPDWVAMDLATARVDSPFGFHDADYLKYCSYKPTIIRVNFLKKFEQPGTVAVALGWGHTNHFRPTHDHTDYNQEDLHYTSTVVIEKEKCGPVYQAVNKPDERYQRTITYLMLCTYGAGDVDSDGVPNNYVDLWKNYNDTYQENTSFIYSWSRRYRRYWRHLRQANNTAAGGDKPDGGNRENPSDDNTKPNVNETKPYEGKARSRYQQSNAQIPRGPRRRAALGGVDPSLYEDITTKTTDTPETTTTPTGDKSKTTTPTGDKSKTTTPTGDKSKTTTPTGDKSKTTTPTGDKSKTTTPTGDKSKTTTTPTGDKSKTTTMTPTVDKTTTTPTIDFGPGLGNGICQNDHGGPLVAWVGGHEVVIGVATAFRVTRKMECKGPFLFASTACSSKLIQCTISGLERRRSMGCDNFGSTGYQIVEKEVSWDNHSDAPKTKPVEHIDEHEYDFMEDIYQEMGNFD